MKAIVALLTAVILSSFGARADVTNIGQLFSATNFNYTYTVPTGSPAINAAGDVAGMSYTVFPDYSEQQGEFRYSNGKMQNLNLGGIFGITDDGAVWGGFLACAASTSGVQRLGKGGSCTSLPGADNNAATGVSVSPSGHWVLGEPNGFGFGRPMLAWERGTGGTYSFYNLGAPIDPFTDSRFSFPSGFTATNINERGEFAVTASNSYQDSSGNYLSIFHAYLYRVQSGVAVVAVDLGEGIIANAVNDAGYVAGLGAPLAMGNPQGPFVYSDGQFQTWSAPDGWQGPPPTIVGINDGGQIAFSGGLADSSIHSFLRKANGSFVDVGSIFPAGDIVGMIAVGLNNRGQIVGWGTDYSVQPDIAFYTWIFQDDGDSF